MPKLGLEKPTVQIGWGNLLVRVIVPELDETDHDHPRKSYLKERGNALFSSSSSSKMNCENVQTCAVDRLGRDQ